MRTPKQILIIVGWNFLVFLVLISLVDIGARFFIRGRSYALFDDSELFVNDRPFIIDHQTRGFALQPNFSSTSVRINSDGFRGSELPATFQSMYKVLVVGESTTFGWKVSDKDTYPYQLQTYLHRAGADSVCVVNAGVPSYTSLQTLIYVRELLLRIKPHLVIVNIMWNDIWYSSLDFWFPEMLVLRRPSAWRRFLLKHSGLYLALSLHASSGDDVGIFNRDALDFYGKNLECIVVECRKHGVEPVLLHPPFDSSISHVVGQAYFASPFMKTSMERYLRSARDIARKHGIPFIEHRLSGGHMYRSALFRDQIHPTAAGNRLIAEDLGKYLLENVL